MNSLARVLGVAAFLVGTTRVAEGGGGTSSDGSTKGDLAAHLSANVIGEVLASELLSAQDLKPVLPGSIEAAVTSLKALDKNGKLAPGIAVELTPFSLYLGRSMTWNEYKSDPWLRNWSRASLSVATASEGSGDNTVVRSAVALRFRLQDGTDWRLNTAAIDCARGVLEPKKGDGPRLPEPPRDQPPDGPNPPMVVSGPKLTKEQLGAIDKCLTDNVRWNATQSAVGVGFSMRHPGGDISQTEAETVAGFLGASIGWTQYFNLVGSVRFTHQFMVADALRTAPASNLLGLGVRIVVKLDWLVLNVDGGLGREWADASQTKGLFGATAQVKVGADFWVQLGVNWHYDKLGGTGSIDSGIKWSYSLSPKQP